MAGAVFDFRSDDGEDYQSWTPPPPPPGGRPEPQSSGSYAEDFASSFSPSTGSKGRRSNGADNRFFDSARRSARDAISSSRYGDSSNGHEADAGGKAAKIPKTKVAQHQELCLKVHAYASHPRFAPAIRQAGLRTTELDKRSVSELEELLERCRIVALNSAGTNGGVVHQVTYGACRSVEAMMPPKVCDLTGFAERVSNDEEAKVLMDLAALDSGFALNLPMPVRMMMCLSKLGMQTAAENRALTLSRAHAAQLQRQLDEMQGKSQPPPLPVAPPAAMQQGYSPSQAPPATAPIAPVQQPQRPTFRDWE